MTAHDFEKVPLITAFITAQNFDIACLSETFLDSTIHQNNENIKGALSGLRKFLTIEILSKMMKNVL